MSERIKITDLTDVQDGDMVTVEIAGRQYTGPAYAGEGDSRILLWGGYMLRYSSGKPGAYVTFVSATREAPTLPTESGSMILVHEALGETCDPPVVAVHDGDSVDPWRASRRVGAFFWFSDGDIARWQECDVTPRGEVVERCAPSDWLPRLLGRAGSRWSPSSPSSSPLLLPRGTPH